MPDIIYPQPEWPEESMPFYTEAIEKKLKKLTGNFAYRIEAEPEWGIDEAIYLIMLIEAGKMNEMKMCTQEYAHEKADYVFQAVPAVWKRILKNQEKFVGAFMAGRVRLEKGDKIGALKLGPYAPTLCDVLTLIDLKFPDELSEEELAEFKTSFEASRQERGV